jgi:hypothetical protein
MEGGREGEREGTIGKDGCPESRREREGRAPQ